MSDKKPILCLDFDGVLHRYDSGWKGADVIPDPMTDGAAEFLDSAIREFRVAIFSSRSNQPMGIEAMQVWLRSQLYKRMDRENADRIFGAIEWPREKPPAMVTLDDRAVQFRGWFPPVGVLRSFKTWQQEDQGQSLTLGSGPPSPGAPINQNALGAVGVSSQGWHDYNYPDRFSPRSPRRGH